MVVSSSLVNAFLFKPPKPPRDYDFPTEVIRLQTARGQEIAATFVRRRGANVTILFSHGNAEDLNSSFWYLERLSKACEVNVMCYDYTGYGCINHGKWFGYVAIIVAAKLVLYHSYQFDAFVHLTYSR